MPALKTNTRLVWRLQFVMLERGIRSAAELHRRLLPYGLDISRPRLTEIVKKLPARLNTDVLHALMVELQCSASDLFWLQEVPAVPAATKRSKATAPVVTPAVVADPDLPTPRKPSKTAPTSTVTDLACPSAPSAEVTPSPPSRSRPSKSESAQVVPDTPPKVLGPPVTSLASRRALKTP